MLSNSKRDVIEIPTSIHGNMLLSEKVITDDKYTKQEIASMVQGRFWIFTNGRHQAIEQRCWQDELVEIKESYQMVQWIEIKIWWFIYSEGCTCQRQGYSKASWQKIYFQIPLSSPPKVVPLPSSPLRSPRQLCPAATKAWGQPWPTAQHAAHPALVVTSTKPRDSSIFSVEGWNGHCYTPRSPPRWRRDAKPVFSTTSWACPRDGRGHSTASLHLTTEGNGEICYHYGLSSVKIDLKQALQGLARPGELRYVTTRLAWLRAGALFLPNSLPPSAGRERNRAGTAERQQATARSPPWGGDAEHAQSPLPAVAAAGALRKRRGKMAAAVSAVSVVCWVRAAAALLLGCCGAALASGVQVRTLVGAAGGERGRAGGRRSAAPQALCCWFPPSPPLHRQSPPCRRSEGRAGGAAPGRSGRGCVG